MMPLKFFSKSEKEKIIEKLSEQFGIKEIQFNLAKWGKERIIVLPENLNEKEIEKINEMCPIDTLGLYFAKEHNDGIRLSLEGTYLLKEQIKKNIVELDEKQAEQWMLGQEISIEAERGFVILKHKNDFLGCGKSSNSRITNFVPKSRRLKSKEN